MKKTIAAVAIAGSLTFVGAGAAQALTYNPTPSQGTVSDGTVAPGEAVVFSSNQGLFTPGEIIDITVDFVAGEPAASGAAAGAGRVGAALGGPILPMAVVLTDTVTADAEGNFSYSVTLEEEGTYTLTATGRESGVTVSSTVVVDAPEATVGGGTTGSTGATGTTSGGLANTGIDSAMLLWGAAGIGALGLGAGSIFVARRRAGAEA
ncbi:hypothetical protein ASH00_11715 [Arthrobacter sp. Soil782]|uniref:LPXTG cell wall anchor domain-containing protein n=1 Tax=Arthrobacter sp. Soil782 TaxID=1736410 RepID=UPI0006F4050E|nr:LPXTG cell wall anchor domain-containing protein [Arthrobacter sp. Soil782]KRF05098.1 hypothetical protein ASH00_11715 [Arthrobacter sp. Soil782]